MTPQLELLVHSVSHTDDAQGHVGWDAEDGCEPRDSAVKTSGPRDDVATGIPLPRREGGIPPEEKGRGRRLSASPAPTLRPAHRVIFNHVSAEPSSDREIAEAAGFFRSHTRRHLEALVEAGLVVREAPGWRRR